MLSQMNPAYQIVSLRLDFLHVDSPLLATELPGSSLQFPPDIFPLVPRITHGRDARQRSSEHPVRHDVSCDLHSYRFYLRYVTGTIVIMFQLTLNPSWSVKQLAVPHPEMHPSRRTWRVRGIPRHFDRDWLARALRHHSDLEWPRCDRLEDFKNGGNDVIIRTLAPDLRVDDQVATVCFHNLPSQLSALGVRGQLPIKVNKDPENLRAMGQRDCVCEVIIDEHFDGITTLFSPVTDEEHQIDVLAVSGLGSHPFGSFVHKEDGNMWLTNNLPRDIPAARVMIFGYESTLLHSTSHVQLDDLASPLQIAISQILRSKNKRPLLLIGHSLGGLLVKQALIRIAEPGFEDGLPSILELITGIVLFGTPNDGLDIESLVPMVNNQPNRSLLESLSFKNSQVLRRQRHEFSKILERTKLQLFCLYETEESPTAIQVCKHSLCCKKIFHTKYLAGSSNRTLENERSAPIPR